MDFVDRVAQSGGKPAERLHQAGQILVAHIQEPLDLAAHNVGLEIGEGADVFV